MIKDVLIVGLGGVGAVYASMLGENVRVLVKPDRLDYYKNNPTIINGKKYCFNYVSKLLTPPDLIIIAAKFYNLDEIIKTLTVKKGTIIISLMNGISSEEILQERFPQAIVVPSYLICNSIIRKDREIVHDGKNKIVMGVNKELSKFFETQNINYEISEDIKSAMWQKFMLNIIANQLSAVTKMTFGEMNSLLYIDSLLRKILNEVDLIAKAEGVNVNVESTISTFKNMAPYGKTSMLQDIENNRKTEIAAFAGTIIELGKKHDIQTPYNTLFNYLLNNR